MKKNIVFLFLILYISPYVWSQPRPVKLSSTVIIDTDCGMDDMRAISILLSCPEITVKAITISDGSLPPGAGANKVISLLNMFDKKGIPVIMGKTLEGVNPEWRKFNMNVSWGINVTGQPLKSDAVEYLAKELKSGGKATLVCLGPLSNIGNAVKKDPSVLSGLDRIVWYNESVKPPKGFNYECDKANADFILKSKIRIDIISNLDREKAIFDNSLADLSRQSDTPLAEALNHVYGQKIVVEQLKKNHFRMHDDLVALYITTPELFSINTDITRMNVRFNSDYSVESVREALEDMIKGTYANEQNIVFNRFPVNREMFKYDVRPIVDSAIARYGYEEWKANVMTDEFHGHLGVFSIVGAKMGIKARELFGVGPDMLEVITFAGSKPPYSCLTDGIQVSTGATLGMGTIELASDSVVRPSAIFMYNKRAVRITLKKEYLEQVDRDINEGIVKFGLLDDGYWKLIRHNALKYWLEWDRNKIFDIAEIKAGKE